MPARRDFKRKGVGLRPYRKLYLIAAEGEKTEVQYFQKFNNRLSTVHIQFLKSKGKSAPPQLLKRLIRYIDEAGLKDTDEVWIVIDKDAWSDDQINALFDWSSKESNRGLALSNPKFEYWLLLHFEDGMGVNSSRHCTERLRRHLPSYGKNIDTVSFTNDQINDAIRRAQLRDTPPCEDWPRSPGCTTVYRLVKNLIT